MIDQMLRRSFRRILTPPMVLAAALFLFIEEWLWVKLTAAMAVVARWPVVRWTEQRLAALPPWAALVCFFLPGVLLLPVKIGALFLMGRGYVTAGIGLIVSAKVLGTALVARFFTICRPTLMGVRWFRILHDWVLAWKARVFAYLQSMPAWKKVLILKNRLRAWMARIKPGVLARRWRAIGLRLRRRTAHSADASRESADG